MRNERHLLVDGRDQKAARRVCKVFRFHRPFSGYNSCRLIIVLAPKMQLALTCYMPMGPLSHTTGHDHLQRDGMAERDSMADRAPANWHPNWHPTARDSMIRAGIAALRGASKSAEILMKRDGAIWRGTEVSSCARL